MNSLGSPLAHGGKITSPSLVPFCLLPASQKEQRARRHISLGAHLNELRNLDKAGWLTQVEVIGVEQELGEVEELGDELLDVGHVVLGGGEPGFPHAVEHSVGQIKVTPLQREKKNK